MSMKTKAKRLFDRPKIKRGTYAPKKITYTSIEQKPIEVMLDKLLQLRRYADHKLIKQIADYQKQRQKEERARYLLEIPKIEQWMLTSSQNKLGLGFLNRIRNNSVKVSLTLYAVFFFYLLVYAGNVTGRVVESGSNYGVAGVKVELFVNGSTSPNVTFTNAEGDFTENPLSVRESTPVELNTLEAAVGPNPGALQTLRFHTPKTGEVEITVYELATGQRVKKLFSGNLNAGTYKIDWDGMDENNQRVSDGRYIYIITAEGKSKAVKTIVNKAAAVSTGAEYLLKEEYGSSSSSKVELETWQLDSVRFSAENIETQTLSGFQPQTGDLNIGTVAVEGTNIITGYAYDLYTKYVNRTGVPNLVVKIKSIPEKIVTTSTSGIFTYKTTRTGSDRLIITSDQYYNWKHPININALTEVKAFNDTTEIPMIQRYADPENGEDLIEFTQKITRVAIKWLDDPVYKNTVPRLKNNLVYLNRQNAPVDYYPDSSFAGIKSQEDARRIFTETLDSTAATIHMLYNNVNVGNGENMKFAFDEQGPYIKNWDINIRGPPSPFLLEQQYVAPVVAHELEHAIFSSGEHSPYAKDLISISALSYHDLGYPNTGSEKEILARKILSHLERNPKLLEYYK